MGVKPGYKETEVGIIPEDWEVRPFLEAVSIGNGQVDPRSEPYASKILIAPDHIESGSGRIINKVTARDQNAISGKYQFSPGDIIYSKIRPYLRKACMPNFDGLCSADMYPLRSRNGVHSGYIFANILAERFSSFAESVSARSGIPKINRDELAQFALPIPPLPEQQAIASALSDTDDLIAALEALTAKKQAIKQGAMQELLTGRKRLPGFVGEWEEKRLGDIVRVVAGGTPSTSEPAFWDGDIPWCTPTDLTAEPGKYLQRTQRKITAQGMANSAATILPPGTLLFCSRASVGEMKIATFPVTTNQGFQSLICGPQANNEFLYYLINLQVGKFLEVAKGSTFLEISGGAVRNTILEMPKIEEQQAIASVLSDMDSEIAQLEDQLSKTRALKQGMMQELLTGRIRLV